MHEMNAAWLAPRAVQATIAGAAWLVAATALASPASAHIGVELSGGTPTAGKSSTIYLRPGHGCDGDATNAITVTLPDGATSVKGQQKAGWTLTSSGNSLTWQGGSLPDDQWDTFGIRLIWPKLGDGINSQVFALPTVQMCNAELTVKRSGKAATITGTLPAYAGKKVSLRVDSIPLTAHEHLVGEDGSFVVVTTAAKVPPDADVTAWVAGRMVGNAKAGTEAWIDTQGGAAMPAPTVTVIRG